VFRRHEVPSAAGDELVIGLAPHLDAKQAVRPGALAKDLIAARGEAVLE
jgi:hypothetical protein